MKPRKNDSLKFSLRRRGRRSAGLGMMIKDNLNQAQGHNVVGWANPALVIAGLIEGALDPRRAPGKVKVLTDEEKKAYEAQLLGRR